MTIGRFVAVVVIVVVITTRLGIRIGLFQFN
jgi:uncharacterized membrane protein